MTSSSTPAPAPAPLIAVRPSQNKPADKKANLAPLQILLFFLTGSKPASVTDAPPPRKETYILVLTTLTFAAAFPIMFVFASDKSTYEVIDLDKRKRAVLNIGLGAVSALENITRACGASGGSAFLCALVEWYYTIRLYQGGFLAEHIEEAFNEGT
ncbi:hypothetical protein BDV06DRAFT_225739 [Aspergillus oleicola]